MAEFSDPAPPPPPSVPQKTPVAVIALRSMAALVLREISTRFGRTPGGIFWIFAQPIGTIIILTIAFSLLMRSPPLGNSFILFYASGMLPFGIYAGIQGAVQNALSYSRPLLMYPAVGWIDALLARLLVDLVVSSAVLIIVLYAALQISGMSSILEFGPMMLAVLLLALVGFGIGAFNCALAGLYPVWGTIWGMMSRPIFLASGIIFLYDGLTPFLQNILWYTPWIHLTGLFRSGVYVTYNPDYITLTVPLFWALPLLLLGLLLVRRHHKTILME